MRVAIFTRPPIPGRCKTRLARAIGDARAAELHAAFVIDTITHVRARDGLRPELHVTEDHPFFAPLCTRFDLPPPIVQVEGDLGARMSHALDLAPGPACVIGTDAPTLPHALIGAASIALGERDFVCTPASDGGYVLIGSASRAPSTFLADPRIRWSSRHALADTMRAAPSPFALTAPWYDVDEPADLALLTTHLTLDPRAAPATADLLLGQRRRTSTF
ncbi:TIGR04282 family arsenosugar biosynthesis glycosyltransferase [Sandaracinus amylolyticus]|uniref:TIGR04282 family arsenosugar biosynthesis glycosyltransferase n=1 Tax=Sandaracinus amylolyticus TaxID=927083 RepID=UPI001F435AB3|nr:TIGR04282 family arsenosugar biosynthesis glycosyltransferase [Sandaracinus amylolyticus]UJR86080.1 Hypothetical protein I5071_81610 [Sandaracinus amylolyticus]